MYSFVNKTYRLSSPCIAPKIPTFLDFVYNIILLLSFLNHVNILTNSEYSHFKRMLAHKILNESNKN